MATGKTKMQAWLSVVAAVLNVVASVWLVQRLGSTGVILGTVGSYVLLLIGPQTWQVIQILRSPRGAGEFSPVEELIEEMPGS